jgi:hypothetical protein
MKSELLIFGKIIKKYRLSKKDIKDLNIKYEKAKIHLTSYGPLLAGRLDSELNLLPIIQKTSAFKTICKCMDDYINTSGAHHLLTPQSYNLKIISCWMNDMTAGEYNPPHTHHDGTGFSTVLFLKIPQFINDAKDPHKFKDGQIGFVGVDGVGTSSYEPVVGDFYIFRADHQHCVMPFKVKKKGEIRRSMSFNFILQDLKKTDE